MQSQIHTKSNTSKLPFCFQVVIIICSCICNGMSRSSLFYFSLLVLMAVSFHLPLFRHHSRRLRNVPSPAGLTSRPSVCPARLAFQTVLSCPARRSGASAVSNARCGYPASSLQQQLSLNRYKNPLEGQRRRQQVWTGACAAVNARSLRRVDTDVLRSYLR